jgi:hypothetical protein
LTLLHPLQFWYRAITQGTPEKMAQLVKKYKEVGYTRYFSSITMSKKFFVAVSNFQVPYKVLETVSRKIYLGFS